MDSQITLAVQLHDLSTSLFNRALEGTTREELCRQIGSGCNPLIWVAGHLTVSRCMLWKMVGGKPTVPWPEIFSRGSQPGDATQYPELDEILSLWESASAGLMQRFGELNDAELSQPSPRNFPNADKTLRSAIHFLIYHEAYHVGQMVYLRKWLGKGSLVG